MDLIGAERAGKAISLVLFGIVCATVFGIPLGTLTGDALGWRSAFGILAVLAFAKAGMLQIFFPATHLKTEKISLAEQMKILRNPLMVGHIILSVLLFTGMFTTYTYLADMLERIAGFSGSLVGWTLMAFGAVGLFGNSLGGKAVDWNPLAGTLIFSALMASGMLVLVPGMRSTWGITATLGAWGISQAALFVICHVRLMKAAPNASAFAASLNISAANLGIGLGAMAGAGVIDSLGIGRLGLVSACIIGSGIVLALVLMDVTRDPVLANECA